jgi:hypothetical protein
MEEAQMEKAWCPSRGIPVPAVLVLVGLFLPPAVHAQKTIDRSPFREMNLDRPSAQILVLNEPESPLLLSDGKVQSGSAGGKRVLQFKVKNRSTDDVSAYIVVAFLFDPDGRLMSGGALPPGGKVKPGKSVTGEMPLEVLESQQSRGDSSCWPFTKPGWARSNGAGRETPSRKPRNGRWRTRSGADDRLSAQALDQVEVRQHAVVAEHAGLAVGGDEDGPDGLDPRGVGASSGTACAGRFRCSARTPGR